MFSRASGNILKLFIPKSVITETRQYLHQTHYDILGLHRNCSRREIKDAFIKLSKRYHPDKTARKSSHNQFIKVLEAYNVLSKPDSRRNYDWELAHAASQRYDDFYTPPRRNTRARGYSYDDPSFYANRDKSQDRYYESKAYYGVPGIRRVSNGVIALICVIFTVVGVTLQYFAIRYSMTLKRDLLAQKSKENEDILAKLQEEAMRNGNEVQIQLMEKRLVHDRQLTHDRPLISDRQLVPDRKLIHDRFYSQYKE